MVFVTNIGRAEEVEAGCPEQENQKLARMGVQHWQGNKFRAVAKKNTRVPGPPPHAARLPETPRLCGHRPDPLPTEAPASSCPWPTPGAARFALVLLASLSPSTRKKG